MIDAVDLKENLTSDDIIKIIADLVGAEPFHEDNKQIIFPSFDIHIDFEQHKKKLYYYKETHSFYCYTASESYDIYSLIETAMGLRGEDWDFIRCLKYVCAVCGIENDNNYRQRQEVKYRWQKDLMRYVTKGQTNEFKVYDEKLLKVLDDKYYTGWVNEGISVESMQKYGVKFYGRTQQIVIPVRNAYGQLVGTHCRNLNPQLIENGRKYDILRLLNGTELKFNTRMVLFGLDINKENIKQRHEVFLFESPKSVLQCENILKLNTAVAMFGMNLHKEQLDLLIALGVKKFNICLDRQYEHIYEDDSSYTAEYEKYRKIVDNIILKVKPYGEVNVIKDTGNLLDYKDSPSDKGKETFIELYKNRERI
jgi:hypothetical protein